MIHVHASYGWTPPDILKSTFGMTLDLFNTFLDSESHKNIIDAYLPLTFIIQPCNKLSMQPFNPKFQEQVNSQESVRTKDSFFLLLDTARHSLQTGILNSVPFGTKAPGDQSLLTENPMLYSTKLSLKWMKEPVPYDSSGFASQMFVIHQKNGRHHPVLNLKQLSEHLAAPYLKIETLQAVCKLI
ncbi:hypothetical protein CLU79DRAFT_836641 [Phycomyces nitens]|nr:hypothetical protein CLU79DRAFT_836641 [Phycomyces nitens]